WNHSKMPKRDYVTVSELNYFMNSVISQEELLQNVPVVGEVSGLSKKNNNCYFTLKDEKAQIKINVFRYDDRYLPENGDKVLVRGRVSYYQTNGTISVIAYDIAPFGIGELYAKLQTLKAKLSDEGIFDENHKKDIPKYPQKIAVITSISGAAIQDVLETMQRRGFTQNISIIDVRVQGESCVNDIVTALTYADTYGFDVILLVRGGGSFEELYSFNDERIVRTIYNMHTPIITGVGHETDYTLVDYVSDYRAITPTAAAEKVFVDRKKQKQEIVELLKEISEQANYQFVHEKNKTLNLIKSISANANGLINKEYQNVRNKVNLCKTYVDFNFKLKMSKFEELSEKLDILSPTKLLKKGYFRIIYDNKTITSFQKVKVDSEITIIGNKEKINATVTKKEKL
ncbi:MAG: exodeoxyribonuclease VII large subunit, partial [Clostridia bacterium]|nr:exodeoxyribonuclease VII large subunit [Clostridia bacterium]